MSDYPAILVVDGVKIPDPSGIEYGLQDVSDSEAGRDETATMYKDRIDIKRKLTLTWNGKSAEEAHLIIKAFTDPEYFNVTYYDPYDCEHGYDRVTKEFYRGDITAPFYWMVPGRELLKSIKFSIIER